MLYLGLRIFLQLDTSDVAKYIFLLQTLIL